MKPLGGEKCTCGLKAPLYEAATGVPVGTIDDVAVEASCASTEPKQSKEDRTDRVRAILVVVFLPLLTGICSLFILASCRSYHAAPLPFEILHWWIRTIRIFTERVEKEIIARYLPNAMNHAARCQCERRADSFLMRPFEKHHLQDRVTHCG
jgi:hypothetical protein